MASVESIAVAFMTLIVMTSMYSGEGQQSSGDQVQNQSPQYGDLRLVNQSVGVSSGRLEVFVNGSWGTVCDDSFTQVDADVACRQLGFTSATTFIDSEMLPGEIGQPVYLDQLDCSGTELLLIDCPRNDIGVHDCLHSEDVVVGCTSTPQPVVCPERSFSCVFNSEVCVTQEQICNGVIDCDDGFGYDELNGTNGCNSPRSEDELSGSGSGLEQLIVGLFTTMHSTTEGGISLGENSSEQGFTFCVARSPLSSQHEFSATFVTLEETAEPGIDYMPIDFTIEITSDDSIYCKHFPVLDDSIVEHNETFSIQITVNSSVTHSLFGPSTLTVTIIDDDASRVQLIVNVDSNISESFGTVEACNVLLTDVDGVTEREVLTGIRIEEKLILCSHGDIRLVDGSNELEGRVEICNEGVWGTVCDDQWDVADANVVCNQLGLGIAVSAVIRAGFGRGLGNIVLDDLVCNGLEVSLFDCSHGGIEVHDCAPGEEAGVICGAPSCSHGEVRIVDGTNNFEGRVEVCALGAWGTVCDDNWDIIDANIVCKQLGYGPALDAPTEAHFGEGTGVIALDEVDCTGSELSIFNCSHHGVNIHDCDHQEDAGVICLACSHGDVRLVDGSNRYEGRVEICANGTWGTVCDDQWDVSDGQVVCNQLGLGIALGAPGQASFGSGVGSNIILDGLECSGLEANLFDCPREEFTNNDCHHDEDAGVICGAPVCDNGAIRLIGGSNEYEGRVEVCVNGAWGTVCDDQWDIMEADVACKQLGYGPALNAFNESYFGEGNGVIALDEVTCTGSELSIFNCSHDGVNIHDCDHSEDAGVVCSENSRPLKKRSIISTEDIFPFGLIPLSFPAGSVNGTTLCIDIGVVDDMVVESPETFIISMEVMTEGDEIAGPDSREIVVVDNDGATLSVSNNKSIVNESSLEVSITVFLDGQLERDVIVDVSIELLTAGEFDIGDWPSQLTFSPSDSNVTFSVPIAQDLIVEDTEDFRINFSPLNSLDQFDNYSNNVLVFIQDDDKAVIEFRSNVSELVPEDGGSVEVCAVLSDIFDGLQRDVYCSVRIIAAEDGASDISPFNVTIPLSFSAGSEVNATNCTIITIFDDDLVERDESFVLIFDRGIDESMKITSHQFVVIDNDGATLSVSNNKSIVNESSLEVSITVSLDGQLERNVIVDVFIELLTAGEFDIGDWPSQLTFSPSDSNVTFSVPIVQDMIVENTEDFRINFSPLNALDQFDNYSNNVLVYIQDDDKAVIEFRSNVSELVPEDGGSVEVCAVLSDIFDGLQRNVYCSVRVIAAEDGAADISPFNVTIPLSFFAGSEVNATSCTIITIFDDDLVERDESFVLIFDRGIDENMKITSQQFVVVDNDGMDVQLTSDASTVITMPSNSTSICVGILTVSSLLERNVGIKIRLTNLSENIDENAVSFQSALNLTTVGEMCIGVQVDSSVYTTSGSKHIELTFSVVDPDDNFIEPATVSIIVQEHVTTVPSTSTTSTTPTINQPKTDPPEVVDSKAVTFVLEGYSITTFTPDVQLLFRQATAAAINQYCEAKKDRCIKATFRSRKQSDTVSPDDIVITDVRQRNDDQITFKLYVKADIGSSDVDQSTLESAVEEYSDQYSNSGFSVSLETLVLTTSPKPTPSPPSVGLNTSQIIGIIIPVLLVIGVIIIIVIIITCFLRYRSTHIKSFDLKADFEYKNPIAVSPGEETNDEIEMLQEAVSPNISIDIPKEESILVDSSQSAAADKEPPTV